MSNPVRNKMFFISKDFLTFEMLEIISFDFLFFFSLFSFLNSTRLLLIGVTGDVQTRFACPNCHRTYKIRRLVYRHLRKGCDILTTETMANYHGQTPIPAYRCVFCPYITFVKGFLKAHNQREHSRPVVSGRLQNLNHA